MKEVFKNKCWVIVLLLLAFFISRAALSMVSAAMILLLLQKGIDKKLLRNFLIGAALIVLPVAISGLYSSDVNEWWQLFINKLLLITIGVGILSIQLSLQQLKFIIWLLMLLVLLACGWSMFQFIVHQKEITQSYLVAKVIPVWLDDDHIRFSWLIVISMLLMIWQLNIASSFKEKIFGYSCVSILFLFLHFMAARTGLLCLYVALLLFFIYFLSKKSTHKKAVVFLGLMITLVVIAYYLLPTLHNRIQYVVWDFKQFSNNNYLQGSADGGRWLSLKAGWDVAASKPFTGVGFGDIRNEAVKWYDVHYPQTILNERYIPHNEWLVYLAGSGWLGMIAFSVGLFLLMRLMYKKNLFSISIIVVALIPLITDDSLEGQYGITIFALVIGLVYHLNKWQTLKI